MPSESVNQAVPQAPIAKRENRLAVAGLIASNMGFVVPFAGGIVGVILGIVGLIKTRDYRVGGRGMSIAAIIVGILSIATSAAVLWSVYVNSKAIDASEQSRVWPSAIRLSRGTGLQPVDDRVVEPKPVLVWENQLALPKSSEDKYRLPTQASQQGLELRKPASRHATDMPVHL